MAAEPTGRRCAARRRRASSALDQPGDQRAPRPRRSRSRRRAPADAGRCRARRSSARGPPGAAPRARSRLRPRARARRAARPRGSRARRSRRVRRRMLGTPSSSRSAWINSASAWLRAAGHPHQLALGEARVDLARAAVGVAERRLERLAAGAARAACRSSGRSARPARRGRPQPGQVSGRSASTTSSVLLLDPPVGDPPHAHHGLAPPATRSGSASAG